MENSADRSHDCEDRPDIGRFLARANPGESVATAQPCDIRLTRADVDAAIALGGRYLVSAQREDGSFVYEVDWMTGEESADDNVVRQAGATWGVALLHRETREPDHRAAVDRSLRKWDTAVREIDGRRWLADGEFRSGKLGAVALIGLSLLERLAVPEGLDDPARMRASLDALCRFVEDARSPSGGFQKAFDTRTGNHSGAADPYSSGEALLLLARSGIELGEPDRLERALAWAEEDYHEFVVRPLADEPDPDVTKGYYQWGSMTWFAFATAGHAPETWGRRLIEQALWMVDVHRTLSRKRNTGYAYEGIVPAWEWARRTGNEDTARKLACVVHQGLRKLCSWQLGHPLASSALRSAPEQFHGAVQNHARQSALRIDVTQHQLHALMYARRFSVDAAEHLCATDISAAPAVSVQTGNRNHKAPSSDLNAHELAEITQGVWEVMPPDGWTMKAVAFVKKRLEPQALVLPHCRTYRYGVDRDTVRGLNGNGYALLADATPLAFPHGVPRLKVASVRNALTNLALATRASYPGRIVAVTGSAGKTSTCNMIEDLLQVFGVPKRPTKNFNTFDGVNGEVANLTNEAIAVIEVAASFLSQRGGPRPNVLRPEVAMITSIGEAHLEYFGSPQGVAEVKSNVFDLMSRGTAVIPRDADTYDYMVQRARAAGATTVSFGAHPSADAHLLSYSAADGVVEAEIFGERITYELGALGRHFARNSVGALGVVAALGLDWRRAAGALASSREVTGRGMTFDVGSASGRFTLIDDAYNANPSSVRAAIEMLSERATPPRGRRIAVLADMLELGPRSEEFHRALAEPLLGAAIDRVYLVGDQMRALWDDLPSEIRGQYYPTVDGLQAALDREFADGDVVLFKGSNGTELHKVVAHFKRATKRRSDAPKDLARSEDTGFVQPAGRRRLEVRARHPKSSQSGSRRTSLVFVGDLSMGDCYLKRPHLSVARHRLEENPWSFVELLAPLVQDKSLLVANLETVLAERPADPFRGMKKYQGWDDPVRTLAVMQRLGVDAVSLANNHTMDFGVAPLRRTIAHLESTNIVPFGAGENEVQAARPLSVSAPFGNVHIFAGYEFRTGYARKWNFYASGDAAGVNPLTGRATGSLIADIARTRTDDPASVIVVYPHWSGARNYQWATDEMIGLNSEFLDAGADFVIGHGAHRMQEIVSGREGTTVFSLGNFVFNSPGRYAKFGSPTFSLVARLEIEDGDPVTGIGADLHIYPIMSDNRETGFRPRPVRKSEAVQVYNILAGQSGARFREDFDLEHGDRGWYIGRTIPLSMAGGQRRRDAVTSPA